MDFEAILIAGLLIVIIDLISYLRLNRPNSSGVKPENIRLSFLAWFATISFLMSLIVHSAYLWYYDGFGPESGGLLIFVLVTIFLLGVLL